MECWVNPDNSITPVLQYSNSQAAIDHSFVLSFVLCSLRLLRPPAQQPEKSSRIGYLVGAFQ